MSASKMSMPQSKITQEFIPPPPKEVNMEMQEKWTNCLNLANEHVCGTAFQAFCVAVGIPSDSSHEEKLDMFINELFDKYQKDHDRAQVRATLYLTTDAGGDDDIFEKDSEIVVFEFHELI